MFGTAVGLALATTGCHTTHEGRSFFQTLDPVSPGSSRSAIGVESELPSILIRPIAVRPRGTLTQPVYPPAALAAGAGTRVCFVVLTIGESGRVVDLQPGVTRPQISDRFSEDFLSAIKAAVSAWRFEPARNVYWRKTPGEEDEYLRTETVTATLEMQFTFEITDPARVTK